MWLYWPKPGTGEYRRHKHHARFTVPASVADPSPYPYQGPIVPARRQRQLDRACNAMRAAAALRGIHDDEVAVCEWRTPAGRISRLFVLLGGDLIMAWEPSQG